MITVVVAVKGLLERFKLTVCPLELADADNIFHFAGASVRKKDARIPASGSQWGGRHPSDMSKEAVRAYKESDHWRACNGHAYDCGELRHLSVPGLFRKYAKATDQDIEYWVAYSGYNLYHEDIQASIYIHDGDLYGSDLTHHNFVQEGVAEI